ACPGGCIDGGGQPYHSGHGSILQKRMQAIYNIDENKAVRQSHLNPEVIKLYREYLGEPYSGLAHKLLHTHFKVRTEI
ncbi:iron hydrogenase small subunit, partial [Bacteroides heparinolyticus]